MFLACIWTISRHMGGSKSNGSTSVSASLPQLSPAPSANSLINMYQELMHKIASFFFQVMKSYYKAVWGKRGQGGNILGQCRNLMGQQWKVGEKWGENGSEWDENGPLWEHNGSMMGDG